MKQMWAVFETEEVASVLKTSQLRLNRLMKRYGLGASVKSGSGRGQRRLFSVNDVVRLGFTLWLFRAGLRANVIRDILDDAKVSGQLNRLIDGESIEKASRKNQFLAAWRIIKGPNRAIQKVLILDSLEGLDEHMSSPKASGLILIPIGRLWQGLAKAIQTFSSK